MADALPKTNAEIVELATYVMDRAPDRNLPDTPQLFVSYLVSECGIGPLRVRNVLMPVWAAAANTVTLRDVDMMRGIIALLVNSNRQDIMRVLRRAVEAKELHADFEAMLLEEWDARKFPNQLPQLTRDRALRRWFQATGLES